MPPIADPAILIPLAIPLLLLNCRVQMTTLGGKESPNPKPETENCLVEKKKENTIYKILVMAFPIFATTSRDLYVYTCIYIQ